MPEGSPIARLKGETDKASINNARLRLSYLVVPSGRCPIRTLSHQDVVPSGRCPIRTLHTFPQMIPPLAEHRMNRRQLGAV
jgi:hypothetical protein